MIRLMNHINADRGNPFFALAFSDAAGLERYMGSGGPDLLLVAQELKETVLPLPLGVKCAVISDHRGDGRRADEGMTVYRYSKAGDIVLALMRMLDIDETGSSRRLFRSYAVISPIGRCGKTNLSVGLCMRDDVRGGLYIGMEEYCAFQDEDDVMSNVIYLAKERSDRFMDYVKDRVVRLEDYCVLGYLRNYMDAMELSADDMVWILDRFSEWGRFTTVVWDIGQAVLKDLSVLGTFDEIIVPTLADELSCDKVSAFERLLLDAELGKVVRRMKKVCVPAVSPESAVMMSFLERELDG